MAATAGASGRLYELPREGKRPAEAGAGAGEPPVWGRPAPESEPREPACGGAVVGDDRSNPPAGSSADERDGSRAVRVVAGGAAVLPWDGDRYGRSPRPAPLVGLEAARPSAAGPGGSGLRVVAADESRRGPSAEARVRGVPRVSGVAPADLGGSCGGGGEISPRAVSDEGATYSTWTVRRLASRGALGSSPTAGPARWGLRSG